MATSQLLDRIINDTTLKFGGREALVSKVVNMTEPGLLNGSNLVPLTDELDGLNSMMQDINMSQKERIFWILLFSLMVLVAAGGNIVVIHIVSTNKEMKSVTNYFLVNLSLADTMVSTLNVIFNFLAMLNSHWPFGSIYCKISNFIAILSISASVFTLTAISCDRYTAIIHPLRPRMSHRHAIAWILLIWTLSSALAAPNLIYSVVVEDRLVNENLALTCTMLWPDGRYPLSSYDHIYNILIMVLTYLVPILTMAILYYKVGKELWGHQAIGEDVEKQARTVMAKRKIVKMMIVVVIIFALCWLPYHGFFIVNYYLPTIFQDGPLQYQRCFLIMYWLAMSNSMYNPIIIYFMNSKFRHEFKRVIYFICCCRTYTPPATSIKSDTANQNHLASGNANHHTSTVRFANSNHSARRVNDDANQRPSGGGGSKRKSNRLGQSRWFSFGNTTANRSAGGGRQLNLNQPIEVIVTQPNECDDSERSVVRSDREQEPFIKLPGSGNGADCGGNNIIGRDIGNGVEISGHQGQAQVEGPVNSGGKLNQSANKLTSDTNSDKVWI